MLSLTDSMGGIVPLTLCNEQEITLIGCIPLFYAFHNEAKPSIQAKKPMIPEAVLEISNCLHMSEEYCLSIVCVKI